ncbi:MAG: retropepsin-like domain-containing protein [Nannocystis sp.]|nr:retropepsin-like domain-containing protein [Nannocystis sp.]
MPRRPASARARSLLLTRLGLLGALALAPALGCLKVPLDESAAPDAAGVPATAEAVLARYVEAIGGEAALRLLTQRTVDSRMAVLPEQGCEEDDEECARAEQTGTFLLQTTARGQLYRRTVLGDQVEERGFDGADGWQYQGGLLVLDDPDALAVSQEDAILHWYLDYAARGVKVSLGKPRERDQAGAPAQLDAVRWESAVPGVPAKTMYFDRASGLLREELVEESADGEQTLEQWVIHEDYQKVDGALIPHRVRLLNILGERSQEIVFTTTRVDHSPIDGKTFAAPELPKLKPAKDIALDKLAAARDAAAAAPKEIADQVAWARAAWAAARFDELVRAAQAALKLDAKESEALLLLARLRVLEGQWKEASSLLDRAAKAGVRADIVAAQRAWIASHNRDFQGIAKALEATGPNNAVVTARYRAFVGQPLVVSFGGDGCSASVPLIDPSSTMPMVELEIGGKSVRAILDTGAADVILDEELARELKVPVRSRTPVNRQGAEIGHGQVDALELGDVTIRAVPVDIFNAATIAAMSGSDPKRARAVIGVRLLEHFQVTVDPQSQTFTLVNPAAKCKAALQARRSGPAAPFWIHETHFIYLKALMNDAEGLFLFNTGMQGVDVAANVKAYAHAAIGAPPLRRGQPTLVTVDAFTLGEHRGERLRGAYGYFEQDRSSDDFRIDGMFGLSALGGGAWTLDFPERKLYLRPAPREAANK